MRVHQGSVQQLGAGSWGTGAAPVPGIGHLPGDGDRPRSGQDMGLLVGPALQVTRLGRVVGSWRWALLWRCWGRGSQLWGLTWGPQLWAVWGQSQGWQGHRRLRSWLLRTLTWRNKKYILIEGVIRPSTTQGSKIVSIFVIFK